jgi:hypothetical protein
MHTAAWACMPAQWHHKGSSRTSRYGRSTCTRSHRSKDCTSMTRQMGQLTISSDLSFCRDHWSSDLDRESLHDQLSSGPMRMRCASSRRSLAYVNHAVWHAWVYFYNTLWGKKVYYVGEVSTYTLPSLNTCWSYTTVTLILQHYFKFNLRCFFFFR